MSNTNAHVLLGGAFICGDVDLSTMQVPEGVPKRPIQTKLLSIIQYHCLSQMVNIHPREDKTLDLLFTNSPSSINLVKEMHPIGKADHDLPMLSTTLRLNGSSRPRVRSVYINERTWTVYMSIWRATGIPSFHLTIVV